MKNQDPNPVFILSASIFFNAGLIKARFGLYPAGSSLELAGWWHFVWGIGQSQGLTSLSIGRCFWHHPLGLSGIVGGVPVACTVP